MQTEVELAHGCGKNNASSLPSHARDLKPTREGLVLAKRVWKEIGYKGE